MSYTNLKIRTSSDLEDLALKRGWLERPIEKQKTLLPKAPYYSTYGRTIFLEEELVTTKCSFTINITEPVIVAGNNFGLIYKNYFFPFGFSHSPNWIGVGYQRLTNDSVNAPISNNNLIDMTGQRTSLLGTTNHWGHFFVDAMDRLEVLNEMHTKILISDRDFCGFNAKVDENGIVPQCTQIIEALGYRIPTNNTVPLAANNYYLFNNLKAVGLMSEKPAISAETFIQVRRKLFQLFPEISNKDSSKKEFLYVGRSGQIKRIIKDEKKLENSVENAGGEVVKLGEEPLHQVIRTFSSASKIILVIGSAKFNLLFCKPGTKIMCVIPEGYKSGVLTMVRHICVALGLDLYFYEVAILRRSQYLINSDLIIATADLDNMLSILNRPC